MLVSAIAKGLDYCADKIDIPLSVLMDARGVGAIKAEGDIEKINARYHSTITSLLITYVEGGNLVSARNGFKRAMVEAFGAAFDMGWVDGGGDPPPDSDALAWFNGRVEQELGYITSVFQQAKELRKGEDFDLLAWVSERADGYVQSVLSVYNTALLYAKKNEMLTWHYGETEHCETCKGLNGKKHRASWYIARDYIPGKPGAAMDCHGYRCQCKLLDKAGNVVTL